MTRVKLEQTSPSGGYDDIVEMSSIPREGESICFGIDGEVMTVRSVTWIIGEKDFDVLVRFR